MSKVAILLGPDFEDKEFTVPRGALLDAGHEAVVVGPEQGKELTGKRGETTYRADAGIADVDPDDFDAVVIPGGYSPDKLRTDERFVHFVSRAVQRQTPVFAVCHAPSLLIEADVVRGKTMTSWPSIRTDLKNAGANWVDQQVVEDPPFTTSRNPDDLPAFSKALLDKLEATSGAKAETAGRRS
jgi:protease I